MSAETIPFDDEESSIESDESRQEETDDDVVDRSLRPLEEKGVEIKKRKDDDNDETIVIFE